MRSPFELGVFCITWHVERFSGPRHKGAVLAQALKACIEEMLDSEEAQQLLRGVQGDRQHGAHPYLLWCTDIRERIEQGQLTWYMALGEPREFWGEEWYCALPQVWEGMCEGFVKSGNSLHFRDAVLINPWARAQQLVAWGRGRNMQVKEDLNLLLTEEMLLRSAALIGRPRALELGFHTPLALKQGGHKIEKPGRDDLLAAALNRLRNFLRACGVGHEHGWLEGVRFDDYEARLDGRTVDLVPGNRQRGRGFLGTITLTGANLERLVPLLLMTEILGVGSKTGAGYGRFKLTAHL